MIAEVPRNWPRVADKKGFRAQVAGPTGDASVAPRRGETQTADYACRCPPTEAFGRGFDSRHLHLAARGASPWQPSRSAWIIGRVVEAEAVASDGDDVWMAGVDLRQSVSQAADERIDRLLRDSVPGDVRPHLRHHLLPRNHTRRLSIQRFQQAVLRSRQRGRQLRSTYPHPVAPRIHPQSTKAAEVGAFQRQSCVVGDVHQLLAESHLDDVPILKKSRRGDARPVNVGPILAAQILDHDPLRGSYKTGVMARDLPIRYHNVAFGAAADQQTVVLQHPTLTLIGT